MIVCDVAALRTRSGLLRRNQSTGRIFFLFIFFCLVAIETRTRRRGLFFFPVVIKNRRRNADFKSAECQLISTKREIAIRSERFIMT